MSQVMTDRPREGRTHAEIKEEAEKRLVPA